MIKVGDTAPQFTLKDQSNQDVSLAQFVGKKKVLLAFFPFAFSPPCTDELNCFRTDLDKFRTQDVEVLGISVDSVWTQKAFAASINANYPLLSDFSKEVSKAYGVLRPEGFTNRAYIMIGKDGKVEYAHVMEALATRLENAEILTAIA